MDKRSPDHNRLVRQRAERLGVSVDEAKNNVPPHPQSRTGAEDKPGMEINAVLADDLRRLRDASYPGDDCLTPFEMEQFAAGELPQVRSKHLDECVVCRGFAESYGPSEERREQFLGMVRAQAAEMLQPEDLDKMPEAIRELFGPNVR